MSLRQTKPKKLWGDLCEFSLRSDFLFPLQPPQPPPPHPDKAPARPTPKSLISVPSGSVSVCFGFVWLRFGSVSGPFRGVGWGRGGVGVGSGRGASVRETNITILAFPGKSTLNSEKYLIFASRLANRPSFGLVCHSYS